MSGKTRLAATGTVGLLAGLLVALLLLNNRDEPSVEPTTAPAAETPFEATLYYPDASLATLTPVKRTLTGAAAVEERIRRVIEAVVDPVPAKGLFPDGMIPPHLYLTGATLVLGYGPEFHPRFSGGAAEELMAVDALVDSIVRTFDTVRQVRFVMQEGRDRFIGHVDTSEPFGYSPLFVVEAQVENRAATGTAP